MPEGLKYYTADEVAECIGYGKYLPDKGAELYGKLWDFVHEAKNPTPLGSEIIETPDMRLDLSNDDKAGHWWNKLTEEEQQAIVKGE